LVHARPPFSDDLESGEAAAAEEETVEGAEVLKAFSITKRL
jgi:hypothetical protein